MALGAIVASRHQVALVLTQPDRPAGRGMALQPSAVKKVALAHGLEVFQPLTLKDAEVQARIAAVGAEVMVVAAMRWERIVWQRLRQCRRRRR